MAYNDKMATVMGFITLRPRGYYIWSILDMSCQYQSVDTQQQATTNFAE